MTRHPKVAGALLLCVLTVACEGSPAGPLADDPPLALALGGPVAPAGLTAAAAPGGMLLEWTDLPDETSYRVQRAPAPEGEPLGGYKTLANPPANSTEYLDGTAASGTRYQYRVRGTNGSGNGAWSYVIVTTPVVTAPSPPTGFAANAAGGEVALTWNDVDEETRYELDRALAPLGGPLGKVSNLPSPPADSTSFTDATVNANKRYRYRIRACNGAGCSSYSSVFVTTEAAPAKPTGFAADVVEAGVVQLSWNDLPDETRYELRRSLAPKGEPISGTVSLPDQSANTTAFNDVEVAAGTRYRYQIRGCNDLGCSGFTTLYVETMDGPPAGGEFDVELVYLTTPTEAVEAAFDAAAARWERVIIGDLPDYVFNLPAQCGDPASIGPIDDVRIFVAVGHIDGPGGILGQAGACYYRLGTRFPLTGGMTFDEDDLAAMVADGGLEDVILHEMAHVLGIGTFWDFPPSLPELLKGTGGTDPFFNGASAKTGFNNVGGSGYAGKKVPVENCVGIPGCGGGTIHSHWRESVFDNELMTGYVDATMPMSEVTIRSLADHGYVVDVTQADAYTLPGPGLRSTYSTGRSLAGDVRPGPIYPAP